MYPPMNLTKRKQQILKFIREFQIENNYFPTLEEIASHFHLKSLATIHQHLAELSEQGYLQRGYQKARDITLLDIESSTPPVSQSLELPIAGMIAAGNPIEAIEDNSETLTVPRSLLRNENAYVLKVKGDSMIESLIADGDYVVVQKQDYAKDGDIVVALLEDGTATLKEFHQEKNYIRLQPRNKQYKPIKVRNVIIQGKVLGIIRNY